VEFGTLEAGWSFTKSLKQSWLRKRGIAVGGPGKKGVPEKGGKGKTLESSGG